ncbi:hypothetical protein EJB05_07315 [Eragrostis curvula]|uniref:Transcription initiation factor IIF subunit alpha n=1 Tax=Eragrostis curvula TaxID=38414 RepID=A0A5J9WHM1_9POAL|nr:hypothetical protein EJB05_07315 [Eragrostis curvula]
MASGGASASLALKAACEGCGSASELYGTACRHTTLCRTCGAAMARARGCCAICAAPVTTLIREYAVRVDTSSEKAYSIGRFNTGLPPLSKKKNAGKNRWSLRKEGLQGRQLTGNMREKYYNRKPWILEDETGEYQYQGQTEGSQSATATYYLLMMQGKEFNAIPVGSWYNFSKVAQYKQLTLEEAEEKMNRRRSSASGYERWMMKVAANGAAAFSSDVKKLDNVNEGTTGGVHPKKGDKNEDGDQSDKGEEREEEGTARKNRHGLTTKGIEEDDEEGGKDRDFDLDDEIEKGDDWEHEEIFTDDDEALDIDTEERLDLADPEGAPPEIKQDDNENELGDSGSNLSKSGQELKKLLRRAAGLESDEDDKDTDEDDPPSPVFGPKQIVQPKSEPEDIKPAKPTPQHAQNVTPAFKTTQKRKPGGDDISNSAASKKIKIEPEMKTSVVKVETQSSLEPASGTSLTARATNSSPITEEEIRTVLLAVAPITTQDLVSKFKSRLRTQEEKKEFGAILTKLTYMMKTKNCNYIVLRKDYK